MRILIVNDDGIKAPGIRKLAELSMQLGEVGCGTKEPVQRDVTENYLI